MDDQIISDIKKINWQYLVNRKEAPLHWSISDGSHPYFPKASGINYRFHYALRTGDGNFYHSAEDMEALRNLFEKRGVDLLIQFRNQLLHHVKTLDKTGSSLERINFSKMKQTKLVKILENYFKECLCAYCFLSPMPLIAKPLSQIILNLLPSAADAQKQSWLAVLTYPTKENNHLHEERSLYKLAASYNLKKYPSLLEEHLKQFAWVGTRGYWWQREWKKQDIEARIEELFRQGKNPADELNRLGKLKKEKAVETQALLKELSLKPRTTLFNLIHLAQEYAYLRTWRTDIIYRSEHQARHLLQEVAKRIGIHEDDIVYLVYSEVTEAAKTGRLPITQEEFTNRKTFFANVLLEDKYIIMSGPTWQRKIKEIFSKENTDKINEIKGNVAYQGQTKGRVVIVHNGDDLIKVKHGDILVVVMTFPNFIPALEKAAAFITDEGGILCHAAIVSREMKKPCIIGTKIATQVLHDGDLVEVDADNGIIKIIK
ncbi:MAG: PEP-utilizing enzyme [bacterium]|nr:PEP-utilizing enzyme [bacterium]